MNEDRPFHNLMYCGNCGHRAAADALACPSCGHQMPGPAKKSKPITLLLCFALGAFGAHRFYLKDWGTAIFIILAIWGGYFLAGIGGASNSDPTLAVGMFLVFVGYLTLLIDFIQLCCRGDEYYRAKAKS